MNKVYPKPAAQLTPEERLQALEFTLAQCRSMVKDLLAGWSPRELCADEPNAVVDYAADLLALPEEDR